MFYFNFRNSWCVEMNEGSLHISPREVFCVDPWKRKICSKVQINSYSTNQCLYTDFSWKEKKKIHKKNTDNIFFFNSPAPVFTFGNYFISLGQIFGKNILLALSGPGCFCKMKKKKSVVPTALFLNLLFQQRIPKLTSCRIAVGYLTASKT